MTPVAAIKVESSIIPQNVVTCVWQGCDARIEARARPAARDIAYKAGWKSWKSGPKDAKVEHFICPAHAPLREQALADAAKRNLTVFDGIKAAQQRKDEEDLKERETRQRQVQGRFERYFGDHLTGDQIGAACRVRDALQVVEIGGNARMAYEPGAGINSLTFGSKTISDAVCDASNYLRRCEREVIAKVQMYHHDAWRCLKEAVSQDLPPQELGDWINKSRGDSKHRTAARQLAVKIIDKATAAILDTRY